MGIKVTLSHLITRSVPPVRAVAVQPEGVDVHRARLPPRQPLRPAQVLRVLHIHLGEIQSLQWQKEPIISLIKILEILQLQLAKCTF